MFPGNGSAPPSRNFHLVKLEFHLLCCPAESKSRGIDMFAHRFAFGGFDPFGRCSRFYLGFQNPQIKFCDNHLLSLVCASCYTAV